MDDFNAKMHLSFAVMIWFMFAAGDTFLNPIALLIAAVFPDCDIKTAPAGRILPLWKLKWIKHRGCSHTLWFLLLSTALVGAFFGNMAGVSWAVGYVTHLTLDAMTPMGLRIFSWAGVQSRKRRLP